MITEIECGNVRLFEGDGWKFPIAPLTVFCGTNSSGKSTIIKIPLLLRQSLGIGETYAWQRGIVRFTGTQVDMGGYEVFVSHNEVMRDAVLGVTIEDEMRGVHLEQLRKLNTGSIPEIRDQGTELTRDEKYLLRSTFRIGIVQKDLNLFGNIEYAGTKNGSSKEIIQAEVKEENFELRVGEECLLSWDVRLSEEAIGDTSSGGHEIVLPLKYFYRVGGSRFRDVEKTEDGEHVRVKTRLQDILPNTIVSEFRRKKTTRERERETSEPEHKRLHNWPLPPHVQRAQQDLRNTLSNTHYLGPLRSPGKRFYVATIGVGPGLDSAGEFLPYVLRDNLNADVTCILPGSNHAEKITLRVALSAWLYYLRTGNLESINISRGEIDVATTKDVLLEFKIKSIEGEELHSLVDSGFGYSQVLPILVRGLLASPGDVFIVEQPELHLNPALQVRLAEFFIGMVQSEKQVIIETHSEHVVNAIRVFAAEDKSGELARKCSIYFLGIKHGKPLVHGLTIGEDGGVPNWPRDFFGEAIEMTRRLFNAQRHFRRKE